MIELDKSLKAINVEVRAYEEFQVYKENECHQNIVVGLNMAKRIISGAFDWSRNGGISGYINSFDYDQLQNAKNKIEEIIKKKDVLRAIITVSTGSTSLNSNCQSPIFTM